MLTGTGKHIRHATMRTLDEVEAAWIPSYLEAAAAQAGVPLDAGDRGLTVKVMAGPKRRSHPAPHLNPVTSAVRPPR